MSANGRGITPPVLYASPSSQQSADYHGGQRPLDLAPDTRGQQQGNQSQCRRQGRHQNRPDALASAGSAGDQLDSAQLPHLGGGFADDSEEGGLRGAVTSATYRDIIRAGGGNFVRSVFDRTVAFGVLG